ALIDEVQEVSRGLHPAALARGGLRPALRALVRNSPVPATLTVRCDERLPEPIEICTYYVVSEGIANVAKHAGAGQISISLAVDADQLRARIEDDGCGGARIGAGSGLIGLSDRVEALGGRLSLRSPPG